MLIYAETGALRQEPLAVAVNLNLPFFTLVTVTGLPVAGTVAMLGSDDTHDTVALQGTFARV